MKFKLTETTKANKLKQVLFGQKNNIKTFALISAENPDGEILDYLVNSQRDNHFRKALENIREKRLHSNSIELDSSMKFELDGMHCQYIKLLGSYGELEHSFCVFNISINELQSLAKDFGQRAFWFCKYIDNENAECSYYEWKDNKYNCVETSNVILNAHDFDDFFSQRGDYKFHIWTKKFDEEYSVVLNDILNENSLDEALFNDELSNKYRIMKRINAYEI